MTDRNYVMLSGSWAARKQLGKLLYQRQHLGWRIAWAEGTDFCSTEDDRSWSYYKGYTLKHASLFRAYF